MYKLISPENRLNFSLILIIKKILIVWIVLWADEGSVSVIELHGDINLWDEINVFHLAASLDGVLVNTDEV